MLKQAGIHCNVMFTLFPTNAGELIPLLRFVAEHTAAPPSALMSACLSATQPGWTAISPRRNLKSILAGYNAEKESASKKPVLRSGWRKNAHFTSSIALKRVNSIRTAPLS